MTVRAIDILQREPGRTCAELFPEFCIPCLERLQFLLDRFRFRPPAIERTRFECSVIFERPDAAIQIYHEHLCLPWAYIRVRRPTGWEEATSEDLMDRHGFMLDPSRYSEYHDIKQRIGLYIARGDNRKLDQAVIESCGALRQAVVLAMHDLADFLEQYIHVILAPPAAIPPLAAVRETALARLNVGR